TRQTHSSASPSSEAPTGTIRKSWKSTAPPACAPPERTFTIGIGRSGSASRQSHRYSATPLAAAAARAEAREPEGTAFAPGRASRAPPTRARRRCAPPSHQLPDGVERLDGIEDERRTDRSRDGALIVGEVFGRRLPVDACEHQAADVAEDVRRLRRAPRTAVP